MNTRELAQILLNIPQVGGERTKNIIRHFNGGDLHRLIESLYPSLPIDRESVDRAFRMSERQIEKSLSSGLTVISWLDPLYPRSLLSLKDYPPLLYCRGDLTVLDKPPGAALVGSRGSGASVLNMTGRIGALLARRGIPVVSGLALGCDRAAHLAAIRCGGSSLALMPCGSDYIYPRRNQALYHALIARDGLVLSEYGPSVPPAPFRFVRRDRLQSGMSRLVILMESAIGGGSMHTASSALVQKRPLYVFRPGTFGRRFEGNRALIESGRGIPFRSPDELLEITDGFSLLSGDCNRESDQILFSYE